MQFGDIRGSLNEIITRLKQISIHTNTSACCEATTSSGVGSSIPKGFSSLSIVQTSSSGTVDITMSDGTVFSLQTQGEALVQAAGDNKYLPAYAISGSGTWKWAAIK
jgi:hypothetical protein